MSADNIFQQRHTEEPVYDVDHLPYSLLYEQPQAPVQSSHTVHPYGPVNQQTQYQFVSQGAEMPPPVCAPPAFPAAPLPPQVSQFSSRGMDSSTSLPNAASSNEISRS